MNISSITGFSLRILGALSILFVQFLSLSSAAAQADFQEHAAVIFILDDSGSMESSDPTGLRYTAAQLFVALLDQQDAVGVIRFSTSSLPVTDGIVIVSNPTDKNRIINLLDPPPPDGYTDVKAAFVEARNMLLLSELADHQTIIVFLTDGKPEIPEPYDGYEDEALEAARSLGYPIMSIALTSAGQSSFLNRVANETGGRVIFAENASDLLDIYLQILGDLKDRTVIGSGEFNSPDIANIPLDPALMPYVDQVSFVVSKPEAVSTQLLDPDNQVVKIDSPEISFGLKDPRFVVLNMPQPAGGDWYFELSGRGSAQVRAILYSRLRVQLLSPSSAIEAGEPALLVVHMLEERPGQPPINIIGEASFSAWITRPDGVRDSLDRFYDDGTHGDQQANDGLYSRLYVSTSQPGNYQVKIEGFKGAVPLAYSNQFQAITFPKIVIDQPASARYDIRSQTVPLEIHLEQATPASLDGGGFEAIVSTSSLNSERIALVPAGEGRYTGEYLPIENGSYRIVFEAAQATYQGLPYQHRIETSFNAKIIPSLVFQDVQVGFQTLSHDAPFKAEPLEARQGIPIVLSVESTSPQTEKIYTHFEDLSGFSLLESDSLTITPNGETNVTLHVKADPALAPGLYSGRLVFIGSSDVDLIGAEIPISLELFEPTITVLAAISSTASQDACLRWTPLRLVLNLNSTSLKSEQVELRLDGLQDVALDQDTITVQPGTSQTEFNLKPVSGNLKAGDYQARLVLTSTRDGLRIIPEKGLQVSFQVKPLWIACKKTMIISGLGLLIGVIMLTRIAVRIRRRSKPPIVTGTLIHWDKGTPDLTTDVNLTELNKTEVKIGKDSQNEVVIPDEAMVNEHAVILAERGEGDEVRFTLQPKAKIRKGYQEYTTTLPLEENVLYQMGNRVFKYIQDIEL